MAYSISRRSGNAPVMREEIASLRIPELVADIVQEMNRTIPRDGAMRVARDLIETKHSTFGSDSFHASEI